MILKMGSPFGYLTSILLIFTLFISSLGIAVRGGDDVKCIESEGHALLSFKHGLQDPSGILSSWKYETLEDCCIWRGVKCSNLTSHVIELDLRGSFSHYVIDWIHGSRSQYLSGEIGLSLLELSHLNYLDLSLNRFTGPIPDYIGSLVNLKYLNLSFNWEFSGIVPPHLGNLSSLHTLDLHAFLAVRNSKSLEWLSHLSSLEYLDLSFINLENTSDWMEVINKLPLLQTLLLSDCQLPPPILTSYASYINISTSLSMLDLSSNRLLTSSSIFPWLFNFNTTLIHLNLAFNHLEGYIPNAFGNLTSLSYIDFNYNKLEGVFRNSSWNFCNLHSLSLGGNNFKGMFSDFLQIFPRCALNSLQYFNLHNNRFSGPLPDFSTFLNLKELDLSFNEVSGKILMGLGQLSNLEVLNFSNTTLSGTLPDFSTLKKLKSLDLSFNEFSGKIPGSFGQLSNLEKLVISNNKLSGSFSNFSTFRNLTWLNLSFNDISGKILESLEKLSNLLVLDLSTNKFSGSLPNFSTFQNLFLLDLSSNEFSGKIPVSLGQLSNLYYLNISNNLLEGAIYETHFSKLISLNELDFSNNSLSFHTDSNWVPPFQWLYSLSLSSCKLGPKFPQWLRWVQGFEYLDLSNNNISDKIPYWFWNFSLNSFGSLDLSNNKIRGELPTLPITSIIHYQVNLRSNEFEGQIPNFLLQVHQLDVSNNKFSGFNNSCEINTVSSLSFLDASNNQLSGQLSNCWWNLSNLEFLSLANNHFSGAIPNSFGNLKSLVSLHLNNNNFSGKFPSSFKNLNDLQALDLQGNQFTGAIPSWIGYEFKNLLRLSLRSNQFDGELPSSLCRLNHILFLDVSINNITGVIPNCLHNLSALTMQNNNHQAKIHIGGDDDLPPSSSPARIHDEMTVMWKGTEFIMEETLPFLRSIDFSRNHLTGKIPNEITSLIGLVSLNLSRNHLTREIPENIGQLKSLDFLDLSRNKFVGQIPSSLSQIDRLSVLDLSFNKLSGKIPSSTQLQSFNASVYMGNDDLCGSPLPQCFEEGMVPKKKEARNENEFTTQGFYISLAVGFIFGFWGICGTLIFHRSCRHAYFKFLNVVNDWLYVKITIFKNNAKKLFNTNTQE